MYVMRNNSSRADSKAFKAYLVEAVPQVEDEDDIGTGLVSLVQKTSEKTFLDVYVQLGKDNSHETPKPKKGGGNKNQGKEVQSQQASQVTFVSSFSQEPISPHSAETQQHEWDSDNNAQEDVSMH